MMNDQPCFGRTASPCAAALGAFLLLTPGAGISQSAGPEPLVVPPSARSIELDGALDEPAWKATSPLPLVTHVPVFGRRPSESGEIRILHDGEAIYVGGRFMASEDAPVQANSLTRDVARGDDLLRVVLDTFDDRETGLVFEATPLGVRIDSEISDDGQVVNPDWNGQWEVRSRRSSSGWSTEIRIPFSTLGYQVVSDSATMGLIVARFIGARNELVTHPPLDPTHPNAPFRPSIARRVVFADVEARRARYFDPYVLARSSSVAALEADSLGFEKIGEERYEVGFDAKIGLSSSMTLDATANTDFAQVEADDEVVNLGRFDLFFPEKRQFFQERAGLFTVPMAGLGGPDRFFHSRRIGLSSAGVPLRIWGGLRFVGRLGQWDAGLLSMQTDSEFADGSENMSVLRVQRRVLNDESTVGAVATMRVGVEETRNLAYLADTRLRFGAEYVTAQLGQSAVVGDATHGVDAGFAHLAVERPSTLFTRGFAYRVGLRSAGPQFDPGLGFSPRRGYVNPYANVRWGFFPEGDSPLRSIQPSLAWQMFRRTEDGALDSSFGAFFLNVSLRSGRTGWIGVMRNSENLEQPLRLSDGAVVPEGRHDFLSGQAVLNAASGGRFRLGASIEGGEFFDGHRVAVGIRPTFVVNEHLELAAEILRDHVRFSDRDQSLDADIARLRLNAAIDLRWSAAGIIQYNRALDAVAANLRLRYHLAEGTDIYLVLNEQLNTDLDRGTPRLPRSESRSVILKGVWRFAN